MIRFLHCAKFFCSPSLATFLSLAPSLSQFTHNAPKEYKSLCFSLSRGFVMKGGKSKAGADSKLGVRKKATETKKTKKAAKDPNKPKRPPSAFFVFMEEFRKTYKEKHPNNKSVAAVGKAGGDAWKKLSDAEKAPYQAKADKRKAEYQKNMDAYNRKQAGEAEDEESDKSKSEVHDDDEDDDGSEEEEDDD